MSIYKDKIVIIDIEATCWEGYRTAPEGQVNEIIEVGVCLLDPNEQTVTDARSLLVTPEESVISPFCVELTSITPELIAAEGMPFAQACEILENEYNTRNRLWASWGGYDHELFKKQCRRRKVRYPFSKKHTNLKRVFHHAVGERMNFWRALENLGLEREGRAHRGVDDAYNTGVLLNELCQRYGQGILRRYGW